MDSVTQAVLGAGISGVMLGGRFGRKAYIAGAVLATLPDLDVVLDYGNPLANMIHHRGFSHSVFVLTALAIVLTLALRRFAALRQMHGGRLFTALWLTLVTHPLLDAFTSYGTQLFWPLRPVPTSLSSIFIIDPFYTVPLLVAVLAALLRGATPGTARLSAAALALSTAYLATSWGVKQYVEHKVSRHLAQDGVVVTDIFSTPQPFSILLWRVVAKSNDDHYHEIITGLLDDRRGEHIALPLNTNLAQSVAHDPMLQGLQWFSGNWLRYDAIDRHLVVTDLRMGLGAGYYSFRFNIANWHGSNPGWETVTPTRWPSGRDLDSVKLVVRRIIDEQPPLPLKQWEGRMDANR